MKKVLDDYEYRWWFFETKLKVECEHPEWDFWKIRKRIREIKAEQEIYVERNTDEKWIRIEDKMPPTELPVLVSFVAHTVSDIGYVKGSDEDGWTFYSAYDNEPYLSHDLFVNAWMPLPECLDENVEV